MQRTDANLRSAENGQLFVYGDDYPEEFRLAAARRQVVSEENDRRRVVRDLITAGMEPREAVLCMPRRTPNERAALEAFHNQPAEDSTGDEWDPESDSGVEPALHGGVNVVSVPG